MSRTIILDCLTFSRNDQEKQLQALKALGELYYQGIVREIKLKTDHSKDGSRWEVIENDYLEFIIGNLPRGSYVMLE